MHPIRGPTPAPPRRPLGGFDLLLLVVTALVGGGVLIALLLPVVQETHQVIDRISPCPNNLKQIGLSLHLYHEEHGCFPPAYTADASGRPLHSWRVLLLPFAEQHGLYEQLRLDEPWNSPHNQALLDGFQPDYYHCPEGDYNGCSYFLVNMPEGVFNGQRTTSLKDITDVASETIMVVEVAGSRVNWAEPRDLGPEVLAAPINSRHDGSEISSPHAGGVNVLMADGRVKFLPEVTRPELLRALMTKSGGEAVRIPEVD